MTLRGLITLYSYRFQKTQSNFEPDVKLVNELDGLITFLSKIKYLTYHLSSDNVEELSELLLLYACAHDIMNKSHNFLEMEKAGVATVLFKLTSTDK